MTAVFSRRSNDLRCGRAAAVYLGDQDRLQDLRVFLGILSDFRRLWAAGGDSSDSVICQTVPFGLDNCASLMRYRSSRILRQVSAQACSAMGPRRGERTVSATCAWMRCGAQ